MINAKLTFVKEQHVHDEEYHADFYCVIFYAKQFSALRQLIWTNEPESEMNEASFLKSLSRCRKWRARGGKSRAKFLKTYGNILFSSSLLETDDKFILKQLSPIELHGFLDFGPEYFAYMDHIHHQKVFEHLHIFSV